MAILLQNFISSSGKIFTCDECDFHLSKESDIISRLFQGSSGTAYLFRNVYNVSIDEPELDRHMTTGRHIIRTIRCKNCQNSLGWAYVKAFEAEQKYKEGKFIIEKAYMREVDNSSVKIPQELLLSHGMITKMNYYHESSTSE